MSAEPAQVMATLDKLAQELDGRSSDLADVERKLDPVVDEYETYIEDFIAGWFDSEEGKRLPGEDVRKALAHRALRSANPTLLGEYKRLMRSRERLKRRIETLGRAASAQQSILSALKREMEATGGYR